MVSVVAFIPARSGSQRVVDKNIRPLGGHPTIAYSIVPALESGVFDDVVVSTDSERYADIARHYGASVPGLRPGGIAGSKSPDIEWVEHTLALLAAQGKTYDCFSILRPTSPFRQQGTIRRAWNEFRTADGVDSLRAVEKVGQHPGKMWVIRGKRMTPLMPLTPEEQPWHSSQMTALPAVYIQNASLEIAWTRVVSETRTIAGTSLMPFLTEGHEGLDVNTEADFWYAQYLIDKNEAVLPPIGKPPYSQEAESSVG